MGFSEPREPSKRLQTSVLGLTLSPTQETGPASPGLWGACRALLSPWTWPAAAGPRLQALECMFPERPSGDVCGPPARPWCWLGSASAR